MRATAQCALAPKHGAVCRYADNTLVGQLKNYALTETLRWAVAQTRGSLHNVLSATTDRSRVATAAYDSVLRSFRTPTINPVLAFAAAFNVVASSSARLALVNGHPTMVNLAQVAQQVAQAQQQAGDPALAVGQALQQYGVKAGDPAAEKLARELTEMLVAQRNAAPTYQQTVTLANQRGAAVRQDTGMYGESRAAIWGAYTRADHLRALQELRRLDGSEARLRSIEHLQEARDSSLFHGALGYWSARRHPSW